MQVRALPVLLLSGTPAAGKSTFARWLVRERKFVRIDCESRRLAELVPGLNCMWTALFREQTRDVKALLALISQLRRPIVLDWGFPPHCLGVVTALKAEGVVAWWFSADTSAARRAYLARDNRPVERFDRQLNLISSHRHVLEEVYASHTIETLFSDGRYLDGDRIYARISGSLPDFSRPE